MATLSDFHALVDNRLSVGVISFSYENKPSAPPASVPTKLIPVRPGNLARRLVRGLVTNLPPSVERLYAPEAHYSIRHTLKSWNPRMVIVDDISVGDYIPLVRDVLPGAKVVLRTHNVMHDVRHEHLKRTNGPFRPFVQLDCDRYIAFEKRVTEACDQHWAITPADAARMTELYQRPSLHLTVSVALERYEPMYRCPGRKNNFVHVGSLDFRRRSDFKSFLTVNWPRVLRTDPAATLTLAGPQYARRVEARNVRYLGRVENDADVYKLGRFAVNFQSSTGGLKVKTLTSFAAGRVLVSTPRGVEGLPLTSGTHYWDMNTLLASNQLKGILEDERMANTMAETGRQYVVDNHSRQAVARQIQRLIDGLC